MNGNDYRKEIAELLDKYEDGRNVFIKNDWDEPIRLKKDARGNQLTENWMELMERVTGIIAKSKYGLDTYANEIHVVDSEQMLDVYVNHGMPDNYDHWSHGKKRVEMDEAHMHGQMNLAYELVINSNPSISYCMTSNTKTMQALVIAHAAQGHNAFFKNNTMFKQFTNADEIRADLKRFSNFVAECEDKYGVDNVERILDACHALEMHAIDYRVRPRDKKSQKQQEAHKAALELARAVTMDPVLETTSFQHTEKSFRSVIEDENKPLSEQNLLRYLGNAAPHLRPWERKVINMFCDRAQYFYPQMRTKLMNEGFASFWHYRIMHDLHQEKLISDGMMLEFLESHSAVLNQRDFTPFNPYTLGFAMYTDLKRMCLKPTEEDKRWFPEIAGQQDWLKVHKEAAYNYHDEDFIYQYLSPKVMRDFHMFSLRDDSEEDMRQVTAVHDDDGYKRIRSSLAATYDLSASVPQISPVHYDDFNDRTLTLKHSMYNRRPLHEGETNEVLRHVYQLWQHPIVLATVDGNDSIESVLACPRDHRRDNLKTHLGLG